MLNQGVTSLCKLLHGGRQPRIAGVRSGMVSVVVAVIAGVVTAATVLAATPTPTPIQAPPSAVGDMSIIGLAVSPAYKSTGLVAAVGTPLTCKQQGGCLQLWVSHNGGASWHQAKAQGWNTGLVTIAVDGSGHELLFSGGGGSVTSSADGGETWSAVASSGGLVTVSPAFAKDGTVAVAVPGGKDFLLQNGKASQVAGSGGTEADISYTFSPSYPNAGGSPPSLLASINGQRAPVIRRCDSQFSCTSESVLPGADTTSASVSLGLSNDFASDGVAFAQTGRTIYKSTDGAKSFLPLTIVPANAASVTATPSLALAPGYTEQGPTRTLYVSIFQIYMDKKSPHTSGGVYRSDDGGSSWSMTGASSPIAGGSTAVATAPDGRLFAAYLEQGNTETFGGLLCSTDRGGSWHASCPAVGNGASAGASANRSGGTCTSNCPGGSAGQGGPPAAGTSAQDGQGQSGGVAGANSEGQNVAPTGATGSSSGGGALRWAAIALAALVAIGVVARALVRRRIVATPDESTESS